MVDAIFDVAIFISGAFSLIGAIGLLGTSKKAKRAYLELLSKICKIDIDSSLRSE